MTSGTGRKTHFDTGIHFACSLPQPSLAMHVSLSSWPLASLTRAMPVSWDVDSSRLDTKCTGATSGSSDTRSSVVTVSGLFFSCSGRCLARSSKDTWSLSVAAQKSQWLSQSQSRVWRNRRWMSRSLDIAAASLGPMSSRSRVLSGL